MSSSAEHYTAAEKLLDQAVRLGGAPPGQRELLVSAAFGHIQLAQTALQVERTLGGGAVDEWVRALEHAAWHTRPREEHPEGFPQ